MPLSFIPASHPHTGSPGQGNRLGPTNWDTEGHTEKELTCGQGWTPKGQEKQQPSAGHGPPERRQDTAADLMCGLFEEAPTRVSSRPQAQLHLSCSTTKPFPRVRGPFHPTLAPKPNPLSHSQGTQVGTHTAVAGYPYSLPSEEHFTVQSLFPVSGPVVCGIQSTR